MQKHFNLGSPLSSWDLSRIGEGPCLSHTRWLHFPPFSVCSPIVTVRLACGLWRKHLPSSALVSHLKVATFWWVSSHGNRCVRGIAKPILWVILLPANVYHSPAWPPTLRSQRAVAALMHIHVLNTQRSASSPQALTRLMATYSSAHS